VLPSGAAGAEYEKVVEQLRNVTAILTEVQNKTFDINKLTDAQRQSYEKIKDLETAQVGEATENLHVQQQKVRELDNEIYSREALRRQIASQLNEQQAIISRLNERRREAGTLDTEELARLDAAVARADELSGVRARIGPLLEEELGTLRDQRKIEQAGLENNEDTIEGLTALREGMDNVLGKIGLSSRAYDDSLFAKLKDEGLKKSISEMGATFGKLVSGANLAAKVMKMQLQATIEMVAAQDEAQAGFQKATAAGAQYNNIINDTRVSNIEYGTTIQESAKATGDLFTQFKQFSRLAPEVQQDFADLTVQLDALGVDSVTSSKAFNEMFSTLGMGAEQAQNSMLHLVGAAKALEIPLGQMQEEFVGAMDRLAMYGDRAIEVFTKLAAMAKSAGMETSKLLDVASRFDTFQDAASTVSRLNALLGGPYLNSLQMVHMSEEKRLETLRRSLTMSGKSWAAMNKLERQAYASAAGFSSMAEAGKFFSQNLATYDELASKADAAAVSEEDLAKMAEQAVPIMKKFQAVMYQLALAVSPIIDFLHGMIQPLVWLADAMGKATPYVFAFASALLYMKVTGAAAAGKLGLLVLVLSGIYSVITARASPPFYMLLFIVALGFFAIGKALSAMGPMGIFAALALGALGAAIGLVFYGISAMLDSLTELIKLDFPILEFYALGAAVMVLAGALSMLGNPFALMGMMAMASFLGDLQMNITPTLTGGMEALGQVIDTTTNIEPAKAEVAERVLGSVKGVIEAAADSDSANVAASADLLSAIATLNKSVMASTAATQQAAAATGGEREIKLYMDSEGRRQFARGTAKDMKRALGKELKITTS
jgi:predicted XRE-type DNA-binding protein